MFHDTMMFWWESNREPLVSKQTLNQMSHKGPTTSCLLPKRLNFLARRHRYVATATLPLKIRTCFLDSGVDSVVGYKVRFEDATTEKTRLIFQTDGMLLREAMIGEFRKKNSVLLKSNVVKKLVMFSDVAEFYNSPTLNNTEPICIIIALLFTLWFSIAL